MSRHQFFFLFGACFPVAAAYGDVIPLHGVIDEPIALQIATTIKQGDTLDVDSPGGNGFAALIVAQAIQTHNLSVTVTGRCMSACADFLLAAAKHVTFREGAVVGLHGNFVADARMVPQLSSTTNVQCTGAGVDMQTALWTRAGINLSIWTETTKRLKAIGVRSTPDGKCWTTTYRHRFWYPTTAQLEYMFGKKFTGKLCADDPLCANVRIRFQFKTGTVVVGNRIMKTDGKAVYAPAW